MNPKRSSLAQSTSTFPLRHQKPQQESDDDAVEITPYEFEESKLAMHKSAVGKDNDASQQRKFFKCFDKTAEKSQNNHL